MCALGIFGTNNWYYTFPYIMVNIAHSIINASMLTRTNGKYHETKMVCHKSDVTRAIELGFPLLLCGPKLVLTLINSSECGVLFDIRLLIWAVVQFLSETNNENHYKERHISFHSYMQTSR